MVTDMSTLDPMTMQNLPRGRLLYKPGEAMSYVVVKDVRTPGLWLVEDGWTADSEAAGPFREEEGLRAFRLANTIVPEGCELGPWRSGLGLFKRTRLPGHPNDWSRVDAAWLTPSVSRYVRAELDSIVNETCCAPPKDEPRLDWGAVPGRNWTSWSDVVLGQHPDLQARQVGLLSKAWNVHPKGSVVVATDRAFSGDFAIVDLPPGNSAG
jgi:hypothetical protein